MTEQTRRNIFRYGIAIDLVILATAAGMLVQTPTASLLIFAYAASVSLSMWKGGWKGGLTALLLSIVAMVAVFPDVISAPHIAAFIGASVFGSALVGWATRPLAVAPATMPAEVVEPSPLAQVVPFADEPPAPETVEEEAPSVPSKKRARAEKRAAEKAAAEAQRARARQEREERISRDREVAQRELQERVAAERRAIEEEAARHRAEAEAERQRLDEERRASEQAAEAERARVEAERRAAEEEAERVRAEVERLAAEAEAQRLAAEEEAARLRAEAERRAAEAEAQRLAAEEETARLRAETERRAAEAEAQRIAAEEEAARLRAETERRAAEAEAQRLAAEEEAARLRAEAERRAAEAEAQRIAAEEEAARLRADAERRAAEAEAQRIAAEEEAARLRADAERRAAEAEAQRLAAEEEAARLRAEAEAQRIAAEEEAARLRADAERRAAEAEAQRLAAEETAARLRAEAEAERRAAEEEAARVRAEVERRAAEVERAQLEIEERVAAARREAEEAARQRTDSDGDRQRFAEEIEERVAREREAAQREMQEAIDAQRRQLEEERQAMRAGVEQELATERERIAAERERIEKDAAERVAAAHQAAEAAIIGQPPAPSAKHPSAPAPKSSLVDTISGWFRREERPRSVNLKTKRVATNTQTKRPQPAAAPRHSQPTAALPAKPRLLLIERRRGTADTIAPKLKHRGVEVEVVERWVDAVDEIFRFRPHALFLDIEHPEFDRMHKTISDKTTQLPIVLTGRAGSTPPAMKHSAFVGRPYDIEEVVRIAQLAHVRPEDLLAEQSIPRAQPVKSSAVMVAPPTLRAPVVHKAQPVVQQPVEVPVSAKPITDDEYEITCSSCRSPFNAMDSDWCSCLAKERTLVCTNCLACFCKAAPAYKEKFWVNAPPRLFERKTSEARRQGASLPANPLRSEVKRPLVLTVEDDEEIQAIVQRVCHNLDYGFIWATNGQDGLELAREYRPNMILSDAFMPKLDGREMCRLLKEDPEFAETRMVVMTGLYTDTKYRSEAVKRFHVDDYIAKPVAITDLINLLQKHLEGVTGLPVQEDLHELHRQSVADDEEEVEILSDSDAVHSDDVPLSDLLMASAERVPVARGRAAASSDMRADGRTDEYDVCCFNCQGTFDATHAEWCSCVGRDNTLVCPHCSGCFCKAPAAYRERFWIDAPPSLFERKMIGSKRNLGARSNPAPAEVKRPLILLVEDDENVQLIVRTVVSNMGYGFVVGADGQEGLSLARQYSPDMILSDAFMPKLDGREMCRLLKEDPSTSRSKAVIMTGLYTDRKYRNEALDYFKVDDYVAKPLAVDDLIKLFKKHLPQEVTTAH